LRCFGFKRKLKLLNVTVEILSLGENLLKSEKSVSEREDLKEE